MPTAKLYVDPGKKAREPSCPPLWRVCLVDPDGHYWELGHDYTYFEMTTDKKRAESEYDKPTPRKLGPRWPGPVGSVVMMEWKYGLDCGWFKIKEREARPGEFA